jgi:hypothetical protein
MSLKSLYIISSCHHLKYLRDKRNKLIVANNDVEHAIVQAVIKNYIMPVHKSMMIFCNQSFINMMLIPRKEIYKCSSLSKLIQICCALLECDIEVGILKIRMDLAGYQMGCQHYWPSGF